MTGSSAHLSHGQELDRGRTGRASRRFLCRCRPQGEGQADHEGEAGEPDHNRRSPPGSVLFNSSWTLRVSSASFRVASESGSI
jgi:hypothetical protein